MKTIVTHLEESWVKFDLTLTSVNIFRVRPGDKVFILSHRHSWVTWNVYWIICTCLYDIWKGPDPESSKGDLVMSERSRCIHSPMSTSCNRASPGGIVEWGMPSRENRGWLWPRLRLQKKHHDSYFRLPGSKSCQLLKETAILLQISDSKIRSHIPHFILL